jgi:hypothetical protein
VQVEQQLRAAEEHREAILYLLQSLAQAAVAVEVDLQTSLVELVVLVVVEVVLLEALQLVVLEL